MEKIKFFKTILCSSKGAQKRCDKLLKILVMGTNCSLLVEVVCTSQQLSLSMMCLWIIRTPARELLWGVSNHSVTNLIKPYFTHILSYCICTTLTRFSKLMITLEHSGGVKIGWIHYVRLSVHNDRQSVTPSKFAQCERYIIYWRLASKKKQHFADNRSESFAPLGAK